MIVSCPGTIGQVVRFTLAFVAAATAAGFPPAAASGPGDFNGALASPVLDTSKCYISYKNVNFTVIYLYSENYLGINFSFKTLTKTRIVYK